MKVKYSDCIDGFILMGGWQLLKYIHVAELQLIRLIRVIPESYKKSVLVEVIVYNLFSKVDM
jgi:hypothetical protein